MTQLAFTVSCDACAGYVAKPVRYLSHAVAPTQDPVGLKGAELYRWMVGNPGVALDIRDVSGDIHVIRYDPPHGFACRLKDTLTPAVHWLYTEHDFTGWRCVGRL